MKLKELKLESDAIKVVDTNIISNTIFFIKSEYTSFFINDFCYFLYIATFM